MYERHGHAGRELSETYRSWAAMRNRCKYTCCNRYPIYGGRGIDVCDRWKNSFPNFLADMGIRPSGTTLDRIDGNRGYEPSNCRWATLSQQSRKRDLVRRRYAKQRIVVQLRRRLGLPQRKIGKIVGISATRVGQYLRADKESRKFHI